MVERARPQLEPDEKVLQVMIGQSLYSPFWYLAIVPIPLIFFVRPRITILTDHNVYMFEGGPFSTRNLTRIAKHAVGARPVKLGRFSLAVGGQRSYAPVGQFEAMKRIAWLANEQRAGEAAEPPPGTPAVAARTADRGDAGGGNGAGGDVLVADSVSKIFGGLVAVDDVSFAVPRRSIVSIIGPNGAGKTTFFNMLTGLYRPNTGTIAFNGTDITRMRPDRIMALGMSRTFQNIRLFGTMNAIENVMVALHSKTSAGVFRSILRTPGVWREEREAEEKARDVLKYVGLREEVFGDMSINLAYGDQRRLEIARALVAEPELLLLDEPTAGMNPQESARLTDFMRQLRDDRGLTILLIEHDMKVVMGVSERITVLDHGEKIAEGEPQEVRENERVVEAYLGKQS
jgi:branched-chain amino acid transport system ATP-binding protein